MIKFSTRSNITTKKNNDQDLDEIGKSLYNSLYNGENFMIFTKRLEKEGQLFYDSFMKIIIKLLDFSIRPNSIPTHEFKKHPFLNEKNFIKKIKEKKISNLAKMKQYPIFSTISLGIDSSAIFFDSRFEGGNLRRAYRIGENEYDLLLDFDCGTDIYSQWYFFGVYNIKKDVTVKFNILNLIKKNGYYNQGQQPRVYKNGAWKNQECENVGYARTKKTKNVFFTLNFSYNFKENNGFTYFAHCYPYSYTDLRHYLNQIQEFKGVKIDYIGKSSLGNEIPIVIISKNDKKEKRSIVYTGRVHPGESNSSLIIKGIIDFLLSDEHKSIKLLQNYDIYIIPMLNPDGVRFGNYRCNIYGHDLNRKWINPDPETQSSIYTTKKFLIELNKTKKIDFFCDIHGHSKSKDVFLYGCQVSGDSMQIEQRNLKIKSLAFILSKLKNYFSFEKSSFGMSKYKFGTARIALFNDLEIDFSYTLEASLFGWEKNGFDQHFTQKEYEEIGANLVIGTGILLENQDFNEVFTKIMNFKKKKINCNGLEKELGEKIFKQSITLNDKIISNENKVIVLPKIIKKEMNGRVRSQVNLTQNSMKIEEKRTVMSLKCSTIAIECEQKIDIIQNKKKINPRFRKNGEKLRRLRDSGSLLEKIMFLKK